MTPALSPDAIAQAITLLRAEAERTSIAAAAKRIDYSRPAVSMALAGTYKGGLERLAQRVLEVLSNVRCPHLDRSIPAAECRSHHTRAMPTSSPMALRHWRACQSCPNRTEGGADAE